MGRFKVPKGFTLIELMMVVAIIGLLASIALPKFSNLIIRSKEAAVKGDLGSLRSALTIYYADNEGIFPFGGWTDPFAPLVTGGKYLDEIPSISIPTQNSIHPSKNGAYASNPNPMDQSPWGFSWHYPGSIFSNFGQNRLKENVPHLCLLYYY